MIEKRDLWIVGGLAVLLVNVVVGFHFYERGKMKVALQSTRDSLSVVVKQSKTIQQERDSVVAQLKVAAKKSDSTRTVYIHDSGKVTLHGDTAVTKDSSQVLLPEVAALLRDAQSHIANLEAENASLKFTLKTDSVFIANQAEQIRLNQNIAKMVQGSRFSKGLQAGVGYCATQNGNGPCLYVGYGGEVRFP